jgi:hypothetical protein
MDVELFVSDSLEDNPLCATLRDLAGECLDVLLDAFEAKACAALLHAILRAFHRATELQAAGDEHWWKWAEAAVFALATCHEFVLLAVNEQSIKGPRKDPVVGEPLLAVLGTLPAFAVDHSHPFLQGRCLAAVSRYVEVCVRVCGRLCWLGG